MTKGTAHIRVGRRTEQSPLVPFLILVEVSIMVLGDEYPTGIPWTSIVISDKSSRMWANGRYPGKEIEN